MPELDINPTSVNIKDVHILLPGSFQKMSILDQVLEINLVENMFSSTHGCISGTVTLLDAVGLIEIIPFTGQEMIHIEVEGTIGNIKNDFFIHAITDRKYYTDKKQTYILHFVSPAAVRSQVNTVSRAFRDTKISDMILKIAQEYNLYAADDFVGVDESQGLYDIIVPNMKPLHAIQWLASKAIMKDDVNAATAVFYETLSRGVFLKSITELVKQPTAAEYFYTVEGGEDTPLTPTLNKMTSIKGMEYGRTADTMRGLYEGQYSAHVAEHDIMDKKIRHFAFNYHDQYGKYPHLEPDGQVGGNNHLIRKYNPAAANIDTEDLGSEFLDDNATRNAKQYFTYGHSNLFGENTNNQEDTLADANRKSYFSQWDQTVLNLTIPGMPAMACGDVIDVNIPSAILTKDAGSEFFDIWRSGRALVTSVRHRIRQQDYKTIIQCRKDSFRMPLPEKVEIT